MHFVLCYNDINNGEHIMTTYIIFFSGLIYSDDIHSDFYDSEYMEVSADFFARLLKAQAGAPST